MYCYPVQYSRVLTAVRKAWYTFPDQLFLSAGKQGREIILLIKQA